MEDGRQLLTHWKSPALWVGGLVVALLVATAAGLGWAEERGSAASAAPPAAESDDYLIGAEDILQIAVWNNEAMSRTVPVRPDGKISLPLLNDVQAKGFTPLQLREFLIKRLAEYMPNPEVSVIVTEVRSFKVSVIGEVPRPGRYELKSSTTVLDVLALVGGFNQYAARSRIVVLRSNGKTMKRIPFNYNKVVSASPEQENFYLQSGDIVLVP